MADLRENSKLKYDTNIPTNLDAIKIGAILRIADATEMMAKRYEQLLSDRDYYERRMKEEQAAGKRMANRIRGLQSAITRLKKKI